MYSLPTKISSMGTDVLLRATIWTKDLVKATMNMEVAGTTPSLTTAKIETSHLMQILPNSKETSPASILKEAAAHRSHADHQRSSPYLAADVPMLSHFDEAHRERSC